MIVIELGYQKYVMPSDKALTLIGILEEAECYEHRYWNDDDRRARGMGDVKYTDHVYPNENKYNVQVISTDLYNMAKLAGKPEK